MLRWPVEAFVGQWILEGSLKQGGVTRARPPKVWVATTGVWRIFWEIFGIIYNVVVESRIFIKYKSNSKRITRVDLVWLVTWIRLIFGDRFLPEVTSERSLDKGCCLQRVEKRSSSCCSNSALLVGTPFYSCLITRSLLTCLSAGKKRILSRTVPDNPEWSGSGNKFTQGHLCHFRGTIL